MLVYGEGGLICIVDWSTTQSVGTMIVGAVLHSGDIIDDDERKGMQTMSVHLPNLV